MKAPLLAAIKRYFDICEEEKELAAAASDQTRLLGRGSRDPGRLLREEKMRKRVSKEKPRVRVFFTSSFSALTVNFPARTGSPDKHPRLGTRGRPPVLSPRPEHPAHPHADRKRGGPGERRHQHQRQTQAIALRPGDQRSCARHDADAARRVRPALGRGHPRRAPCTWEQQLPTQQARAHGHDDADLRVQQARAAGYASGRERRHPPHGVTVEDPDESYNTDGDSRAHWGRTAAVWDCEAGSGEPEPGAVSRAGAWAGPDDGVWRDAERVCVNFYRVDLDRAVFVWWCREVCEQRHARQAGCEGEPGEAREFQAAGERGHGFGCISACGCAVGL
jgi:hypothetical protein